MEDILSKHFGSLFQSTVIILLALLGLRLARLVEGRLWLRLETTSLADERRARLKTLISAAYQTTRALILALAVFSILAAFGVNLSPLLASLGLAGLALTLGAQTLIKDYIGGLMILIEDQFTVGDFVTIGSVSGVVERLTLRLTVLRDVNGRLHMISNGDVRLVTNASRDWSLAIVDLNLPLDADFLRVIRLLQEAAERAAQDETLQADLIELPKVAGWSNLTDWSVQARLSAKTRPSGRLAVETALRREALQALHNAGVQLAIPPRM